MINKMSKILLPIFIVLLCACSKYADIPGKNISLTQNMTGLYMFEAQQGKAQWVLEAKKAQIRENNSLADLTYPVIYFKENGKNVSHLTAKQGLMNLDTKHITLIGNVKVKSIKEKMSLTTDKLNYSFKKNKFYTKNKVIISQKSTVTEGIGFEAASDLSEIIIYNQKTVESKK